MIPFHLEAVVGEGAQGRVYRARDERDGRRVAVKVAAVAGADVSHVIHEARMLRLCDHAAVPRVFAQGVTGGGEPYFVTDLFDGVDLERAVNTNGPLAPRVACRLIAQALTTLETVHTRGVIHCDVKPANLFLCRDGRVVLLDFGLAVYGERGSVDRGGTPQFMAPELLDDAPTPASDVYACGATLFWLLTQQPLLDATSILSAFSALARGARRSFTGRGLAADLVAFGERMLAHDPIDRPSAKEARAILSRI